MKVVHNKTGVRYSVYESNEGVYFWKRNKEINYPTLEALLQDGYTLSNIQQIEREESIWSSAFDTSEGSVDYSRDTHGASRFNR